MSVPNFEIERYPDRWRPQGFYYIGKPWGTRPLIYFKKPKSMSKELFNALLDDIEVMFSEEMCEQVRSDDQPCSTGGDDANT